MKTDDLKTRADERQDLIILAQQSLDNQHSLFTERVKAWLVIGLLDDDCIKSKTKWDDTLDEIKRIIS